MLHFVFLILILKLHFVCVHSYSDVAFRVFDSNSFPRHDSRPSLRTSMGASWEDSHNIVHVLDMVDDMAQEGRGLFLPLFVVEPFCVSVFFVLCIVCLVGVVLVWGSLCVFLSIWPFRLVWGSSGWCCCSFRRTYGFCLVQSCVVSVVLCLVLLSFLSWSS
jgi:hypothetical protein